MNLPDKADSKQCPYDRMSVWYTPNNVDDELEAPDLYEYEDDYQ